MVVHVSITKGTTGHGIATYADGRHGSDGVEYLEEESLVDFREEVGRLSRRQRGDHMASIIVIIEMKNGVSSSVPLWE